MKIAVDTQISLSTVDWLNENNFEVVFKAQNESDEEWIEKALDLGANVFISPDLDIPNYLDKYYPNAGYKWIDVKQGLKKEKQIKYLTKRLKGLAIK